MRHFFWLVSLFAASAFAEPDVRPDIMDPVHPSWQLEWDNARPEQRQALDQFYQALQNLQGGEQVVRKLEREEHLERLRDMTPEQRRQQFMDFVHQNPPPSGMQPPPGMQPPAGGVMPPPPGVMPPMR
ncbi:hypothetical protein ACQUQU_00330 [Thalassolituus sp. LLYu03]|uniref:hypothetical protein n=1 Tax=Thalassolituus sp. LLYu03 TaxID=3421656 RepID=UPI003D2AD870